MYHFRGSIGDINPTDDETSSFELYVIKEDLVINPIPENQGALREQAATEGGLCGITIPAYTDTDTTESYLAAVVSSITASTECTIDVCRSEGCHVCLEDGGNATCASCNSSSDCDGLANVVEYRFCDCDTVVTVNEYNEFAMYTGKQGSLPINFLHPNNFLFQHIIMNKKYPTRKMKPSLMTSSWLEYSTSQ